MLTAMSVVSAVVAFVNSPLGAAATALLGMWLLPKLPAAVRPLVAALLAKAKTAAAPAPAAPVAVPAPGNAPAPVPTPDPATVNTGHPVIDGALNLLRDAAAKKFPLLGTAEALMRLAVEQTHYGYLVADVKPAEKPAEAK